MTTRTALGLALISAGAIAACALEEPPVTNDAGTGTGGASGSAGSGVSGTATTGGSAGSGVGGAVTAGTGAVTGGAGGMGNVGNSAGVGGVGNAGTGNTAGAPVGGGGGFAGSGPGGAGPGGAGPAGSGPGGTGGMPGDLKSVAAVLHGYTIRLPCLGDTSTRVCDTQPGTGCPNNTDPVLDGATPTNEVLTFGGVAGTIYNVTVRVQGQVEAKNYTAGVDAARSATLPANGLYTGGRPGTGNDYNVYAMRVSNPVRDYFFNSISENEPAGSNNSSDRVRHTTFDIDYTATLEIAGGATLRMVAADSNCSAIKNCIDPDNSTCTAHSFANLDPLIAADLGTPPQPYNGQFVGFLVQNVTIRP